ncbi:RimK-like ATP-grasp domain-containing protein [Modicisalibacter muralis]|uniref:RimK-like ATP-grasp domain-containing protein n=1 Tax=Modicisalibacter muralis TaxID=119000 RepID=A0A1G9LIE0_9GAMM|nr:hypothetical protein [Halomonas muralis]SDL61674.1 RimK-like ATP-grasp domain-containing protein [Halomonas muralis]
MILLVTNQRDLTTDYIVLELQRRRLEYFRLNTELLPESRITLGALSSEDWSISFGGKCLTGHDVEAAYFRRPGKPLVAESIEDQGSRNYIESEWNALLKSLYMRLEGRWLNSPTKIVLAEDKPRQLLIAADLGFDIPQSAVTNDLTVAQRIAAHHTAIGKPLRQALLEGDQERVIFTTRLPTLTAVDEKALAMAPIIVQQEIQKQTDVRVTVVGQKVFAVAIHSQEQQETKVDWRSGAQPDLKHEVISLPGQLEERCIRLVELLGLNYGAIDLIQDLDNHYWFLEINPNGQWAWIENRTGLPIASAIVDGLQGVYQ